jgi:hypothetical protein
MHAWVLFPILVTRFATSIIAIMLHHIKDWAYAVAMLFTKTKQNVQQIAERMNSFQH